MTRDTASSSSADALLTGARIGNSLLALVTQRDNIKLNGAVLVDGEWQAVHNIANETLLYLVKAEARLAQLTEEKEPSTDAGVDCGHAYADHWRKRAEQAEAALTRLRVEEEQVIADMRIYGNSGCHCTNVRQWADRLSAFNPNAAAASITPPIYYMGCWNEPGHYLHRPDGTIVAVAGPFTCIDLDGGPYMPPPPDAESTPPLLTHDCGWTVLSMWDRTVDTRPGSHATFLAPGTLAKPEMWRLARRHFQRVVERLIARREGHA